MVIYITIWKKALCYMSTLKYANNKLSNQIKYFANSVNNMTKTMFALTFFMWFWLKLQQMNNYAWMKKYQYPAALKTL